MARQTRFIEWGEWLPDQPALGNPGVLLAKNVIPTAGGYENAIDAVTTTIDDNPTRPFGTGPVLGAWWVVNTSGLGISILAAGDHLYRLTADRWLEVSKAGGYSGVTRWEAAVLGDNMVLVNGVSTPQILTLPDEGGISNATDATADSPPGFHKTATVLRQFVIVGGESNDPRLVQWCGLNNPTLWGASRGTQASFIYLQGGGGNIQSLVTAGGEVAYIFREFDILAMNYVQPPVIFRIDTVSNSHGTFAPQSVVAYGPDMYFYGHDGFYVIRGGQVLPIGQGKVDKWFREFAGAANLDKMRGFVDYRFGLILWTFRPDGDGTGINNHVLVYDPDIEQWSFTETESQGMLTWGGIATTLEALNAKVDQGGPKDGIDTPNFISFDSDIYKGGSLTFANINANGRICSFEGAPLQAVIETKEWAGRDGGRHMVTGGRPVLEISSDFDEFLMNMTVSVGQRDNAWGEPQYNAFGEPNTAVRKYAVDRDGMFKIRGKARHIRLKTYLTGSFSKAQGIYVTGDQSRGKR